MRRSSGAFLASTILLGLTAFCAMPARADSYVVTVAGLGGEPDYEQRFTGEAKDLDKLFKAGGASTHVFTLMGADATRAKLTDVLTQVAHAAKPDDGFILTLIGHGSFDGTEYKFNLPGPDISADELAALCNKIISKRQLIVNTTSASGGSLMALQKTGRAIITATKSGTEKNATVFARYWVEALQDPSTDLDKNETISALEAFQFADRKTAAFYETQKRLATEHPQFEDANKKEAVRAVSPESGEGLLMGSIAVLRIGATQLAANDPAKRELMTMKEQLEQTIDTLKYQKAAMDADDYKKQLSDALLRLARTQEALDK